MSRRYLDSQLGLPCAADTPAGRYEFPKQYLGRAQACVGDWILYYDPRKVTATRGYAARASVEAVGAALIAALDRIQRRRARRLGKAGCGEVQASDLVGDRTSGKTDVVPAVGRVVRPSPSASEDRRA